jgi:hypothetical protein
VWRRQVGLVRGTGGQRGQVRAAWWHEWQDEVEDGFLVEPQNQGEPGLRGSQVMSGDWRRLHQVRGVCGGSPENHRVTRLSHKAEAEDRAWLSGQNRPDRFGEPV